MTFFYSFLSILFFFITSISAIDSNTTPFIEPPSIDQSPVFPPEHLIPTPTPQDDRFLNELLNMLATLGMVVGAILIAAWFLKRMMNSRIEQVNNSSLVKILERRVLSPKTSLYLLEVENKTLLIAESINGVKFLTELTISQEISDEKGAKPSFSTYLEKERSN